MLEELTCWKCGCIYGVNANWFEAVIADTDRKVCCPRGHKNSYAWKKKREEADPAKLKDRIKELEREKFQWLHDREQGEARRSDAEIEAEIVVPEPIESNGRIKCPHCDLTYRRVDGFFMAHLMKKHKLPESEAQKVLDSAWNACMASQLGIGGAR
jgi:hypothetical protein